MVKLLPILSEDFTPEQRDRAQHASDIHDIIWMFKQLDQNYQLSQTDKSVVEMMVCTLGVVYNDILSGVLGPDDYPQVREMIKSAYDVYPSVSRNYSTRADKLKKNNAKPFIDWKVIGIGLTLVLLIVWFSGK